MQDGHLNGAGMQGLNGVSKEGFWMGLVFGKGLSWVFERDQPPTLCSDSPASQTTSLGVLHHFHGKDTEHVFVFSTGI